MNKTLLAFFLFCLPARSLLAWYAYLIREKEEKITLEKIEELGQIIKFDNTYFSKAMMKDYSETTNAIGATSASQAIDLEDGNVVTATLSVATTTFTFSNPIASDDCTSFTLILTQDGTGSRAVTWPGAVDWAGGTAPTLTTTAAAVDIITFVTVNAGTTWYGFVAGQDMK